MPTYSYQCSKCQSEFDKFLSLSEHGSGTPACPNCESPATTQIITAVSMVFKGDDWASKNTKISGQMAKKYARQTRITEERRRDAPDMTLVPNVGGETVDSWSEAKHLAASKGKSTKTYDKQIQKEAKLKKRIEV